jgi:uncharacterized protein
MFLSPTYLIFMLPAFLIMMAVQWYVKSAYSRWSRVMASSRTTGAQAAERLARSGGLYDVRVSKGLVAT